MLYLEYRRWCREKVATRSCWVIEIELIQSYRRAGVHVVSLKRGEWGSPYIVPLFLLKFITYYIVWISSYWSQTWLVVYSFLAVFLVLLFKYGRNLLRFSTNQKHNVVETGSPSAITRTYSTTRPTDLSRRKSAWLSPGLTRASMPSYREVCEEGETLWRRYIWKTETKRRVVLGGYRERFSPFLSPQKHNRFW